MFSTTPEASKVALEMLPHVDRPTVRIERFVFADEMDKPENAPFKDSIDYNKIDGICQIIIEGLPPCQRKNDEEWREDASKEDGGLWEKVPHQHKAWCDTSRHAIPFVRGPVRHERIPYKGSDGSEQFSNRIAWGWDGNKEKPSLTPSYLTQHYHSIGDSVMPGTDRMPGVFVHLHVFVGNPYGPGTGRFGPGALDPLESHIKTHDGRQIPMILA